MLEWLSSLQPSYLLGLLAPFLLLLCKFYLDQARDARQNKPVFLIEDHGIDSDMKGRLTLRNIGNLGGLNVQMRPRVVFSTITGRVFFKVTSHLIPLLEAGNQEPFVLEWFINGRQERAPEVLRTTFISKYSKRRFTVKIDCETVKNHRYRTRLSVGKGGIRHLGSHKIRIRNRINDLIWDCLNSSWYGTRFCFWKLRNYLTGSREEEGF